jgi:hypothetical protein
MSEKLQLRVTDEFHARIRAEAKRFNMTESAFTRYLLETALGDDARLSALAQISWGIQAQIQKRLVHVNDIIRVELEKIILEGDDE